MKKFLAILLVATMLLCFAGCGENGDTTTTTTVADTTTTTVTDTTTTVADVTTTTQTDTAQTQGTTVANCAHTSVKKATCLEPATCEACGAKVKDALGHAFFKGACLRCKEVDPSYSAAGPAVTEVKLDKDACALVLGETVTLKATVKPANATDKTVTWTSSSAAVATVDANGMVTAVAKGQAVITASTGNGKTATCTVTVGDVVVETEEMPIVVRYKADYGKVGIDYQITALKYTYDAATKTLKVTVDGGITYAGNGSPVPTTPSFNWKLVAGNGSAVAENTWKADTAGSVGTSYTSSLQIDNVQPGRYSLVFTSTL